MSEAINIEFHAIESDFLPRPFPASRSIPDWIKQMPADVSPQGAEEILQSVKQCPPFMDAMSSGYLIPITGNAVFTMDSDGRLTCTAPDHQAGLGGHPPAQVMGSPWEKTPVVKFQNPWVIVTPPGYSTLFIQPLNRDPIPFKFFSGIVETDHFYREVNFPAACLMSPGTSFVLPRGTPLIQVIPIKRDSWRSQIGPADAKRLSETRQQTTQHDLYRDWYHEKKTYG